MTQHRRCLTDSNNDKDQSCDGDDDPDQVTIAKAAGGEIRLSFVRARGQLGEFSVVQVRDGVLYLLRIHVSGLQRFDGSVRRQECLHGLQVAVTSLRGSDGGLLQIGRADHVGWLYGLGHQICGYGENSCQYASSGSTYGLLEEIKFHVLRPP